MSGGRNDKKDKQIFRMKNTSLFLKVEMKGATYLLTKENLVAERKFLDQNSVQISINSNQEGVLNDFQVVVLQVFRANKQQVKKPALV